MSSTRRRGPCCRSRLASWTTFRLIYWRRGRSWRRAVFRHGIDGSPMVWGRCLAVFGTALLLTGFLADHAVTIAASDSSERAPSHSNRGWQQLIDQATALGLPTRFLRLIEPGFITLEFEDLHTFAAEYHPEDHRMVLNRSLSFNAA